jgi:hypothetical protein
MARKEVLKSIACNLRYYKVNKKSFIISKNKVRRGEYVTEIWNVSDVTPCIFKHLYCSLWLYLLTARLYSYSPRQTTRSQKPQLLHKSPQFCLGKKLRIPLHRDYIQHIHSHSCCLSLILEWRCQKMLRIQ